MTPLAEKLVGAIRADGPITVADYMAACLGDPEHGYYMRRDPFGRGGDFVTAPEVSQMFGELIGAWTVAVWERMGAPAPFVLAELGPGRGTLMADMLRTAAHQAGVPATRRACIWSRSARASARSQRAALAGRRGDLARPRRRLAARARSSSSPTSSSTRCPSASSVRTGDGWAERMVGLADDGEPRLRAAACRTTLPARRALPVAAAEPGDDHSPRAPSVRISPASAAIMATIAGRIARDGGAALIIDYGHDGPAFGDTLQAVRAHRYDDPLAHPGEADLTAHVDFAALADAARRGRRAAPAARSPRASSSSASASSSAPNGWRAARTSRPATRSRAAVERLAGPKAMGDLFKVLAISTAGLALPLFDDDVR